MPLLRRAWCALVAAGSAAFIAFGPFDGDAPESIGTAVFGLSFMAFAYCAATGAYLSGITTPGGGGAGVTVPLARAAESSEEREFLKELLAKVETQLGEQDAPRARKELDLASRELALGERTEKAYLRSLAETLRGAHPGWEVAVAPRVLEPNVADPGYFRPDLRILDPAHPEDPLFVEFRFSRSGAPVHVFGAAENVMRMNPRAACPGIVVYRGPIHPEEDGLSEASFGVRTVAWNGDDDLAHFVRAVDEAMAENVGSRI
jgi:hypothetical protein